MKQVGQLSSRVLPPHTWRYYHSFFSSYIPLLHFISPSAPKGSRKQGTVVQRLAFHASSKRREWTGAPLTADDLVTAAFPFVAIIFDVQEQLARLVD